MNKERLLKILPVQMKHFTEDELDQRYKSYFPSRVKGLRDVLKIAGIKEDELKIDCLNENQVIIENLDKNIKNTFAAGSIKKSDKALKILLINISTHFSSDKDSSEYDVLEPPLGLIALQSYLNREFKEKVRGKIIKSSVDFNSYDELNNIIEKFNPDLIGVSAMTFHKDFFHGAIKNIRSNGYDKMIITGGPHPTTSYKEVLKDPNVDLCVLGEGEATLAEIVKRLLSKKENNIGSLAYEDLISIDGIAFSRRKFVALENTHKASNG